MQWVFVMRALGLAATVLALAAGTTPAMADEGSVEASLPNLGQPANALMPPAEQQRLGAQVVARLRAQNAIIEDPQLDSYLNYVGDRLARHTDRAVDKFHFYVINSHEINAFALPGGYIGVNAGLITATRSESELASVMAHEIAHVTQNHIARQMEESRGDAVATLAAAIVAAVAGVAAGGGGDAAIAAITGGMSHLGMQQITYTRAHEYEADRVGIRDLARSHYDPNAMARFFGTMEKNRDLYGPEPPQILLTHPVTSTRIAEARARAADYPHVKVNESAAYPYMRARARILIAGADTDMRDYFYGKLHGDGGHPTAAERYGYALALSRLSQNKKAIALMRAGVKRHPKILAWRLGLASARTQAGQLQAAHEVLATALQQLLPHSAPLKLAYAQNLENLGKPGAMRNYLLSQNDVLNHYPQAQELLAQGAGRQGNLGEAYYRQARYDAMRNAYPAAINQLQTALQTAHLDAYNKSRLRALLKQMVSACRNAWSKSECHHAVANGDEY